MGFFDYRPEDNGDFGGFNFDYQSPYDFSPRNDFENDYSGPGSQATDNTYQNYSAPHANKSTGLLDLYNQFQARRENINPENLYDPNDKMVSDYFNASNQPPPSEAMYRKYMDAMPTREKYKPSFWRDVGGGLLGALQGLASFDKPNPMATYAATKGFLDQPYNDAVTEWKAQGSKINTEAQLADRARTRELAAMKYGLDSKYKSIKDSFNIGSTGEKNDLALARNVTGAEQAAANLAERSAGRKNSEDLRKRGLEIQQGNLNERRRQFDTSFGERTREFDIIHPSGGTGGTGNPNLDLVRAEAGKLGIPFNSRTPLEKIAGDVVRAKIYTSPTYQEFFTRTPQGVITFKDDVDPVTRQNIRNLIDSTVNRLLGRK